MRGVLALGALDHPSRSRFISDGALRAPSCMLCRWTRNMEKPAMEYANLKRTVDLVKARPAWQRMMQAEGITWANNAPA
jgi:hypothetical protein